MKKTILNLGNPLNKTEQKSISGGARYYYPICECTSDCQVIDNGRCENLGCASLYEEPTITSPGSLPPAPVCS